MAIQAAAITFPAPNTLYQMSQGAGTGGQCIVTDWIEQYISPAQTILNDSMDGNFKATMYELPFSIDLALYDTTKTELVVGTSPGYVRLNVPCGDSTTNWTVATDGLTISNAVALTFVAATGNWLAAFYAGILLHGGGPTVYSGIVPLTASVSVLSGNQLQFAIGAFVITQVIH